MRRLKQALLWLLAIFMIWAGILHFLRPAFYQALIPPMLPAPLALVYISGVFELAFGALLLIPRYRRIAAWGIVATLIAVYPANIYHALSGGLTHPALPPIMQSATFAWARLPLQFVFLAWAWWFTRPDRAEQPKSSARTAMSALILGLVMSVFARPAGATGICEDNPKRYSFLAISESAGTVALTVQHSWCEETEDELGMLGERRGKITYVEIWDLAANTFIERLASPRSASQSKRIQELAGAFTPVPKGKKLSAFLTSRGFNTAPQRNKSPNKRCITRTVTKSAEAAEDSSGFPELAVSVRVLAGKQRLLNRHLTTAAQMRKDDLSLVGVFLPGRKALAVWMRSAMCDGPPPGYFGSDDGGTCYERDEPLALLLTLDAHPELAPCFEAPPAAPAAPAQGPKKQ